MKTLIVNFIFAATLLTGSSLLAMAQKPTRLQPAIPATEASNGSESLSTADTSSDDCVGPNCMTIATQSTSFTTEGGSFTARAYGTRSHWIWMNAGTRVSVSLSGDGDTDLDLYVYDSVRNRISSSTKSGDDEQVDLIVYRSGYFLVKVVNLGDVYNEYELSVDLY